MNNLKVLSISDVRFDEYFGFTDKKVKYARNEDLDTECQKALRQIEQNGYADELYDNGMRTVLKYAMACYKKRCKVMLAD